MEMGSGRATDSHTDVFFRKTKNSGISSGRRGRGRGLFLKDGKKLAFLLNLDFKKRKEIVCRGFL